MFFFPFCFTPALVTGKKIDAVLSTVSAVTRRRQTELAHHLPHTNTGGQWEVLACLRLKPSTFQQLLMVVCACCDLFTMLCYF